MKKKNDENSLETGEFKEIKQKLKESEEKLRILNVELERKVEERTLELKKSEKNLKDIIENIRDSIGIVGLDGKFKYMSPQYSELIGREIAIGEHFGDNLHPDDLKKTTALFAQAIKDGNVFEGGELEFRVKHKDGSYIWLSTTTSNHYDEDGNLIGFLTTARDVSDRKITEKKLKESEEKYREAYNRAEFYKELFAHDMNNILQIISSTVELSPLYLNDKTNTYKINDLFEDLKTQVKRGANLVSNVQILSKLESSEVLLKNIEVIQILKEAINYISGSYQEKVEIQLKSDINEFAINANELLFEVFTNILINGIRHNNNPIAKIEIQVSEEHKDGVKFIKFQFRDNGIGVEDSRKDMIFRREFEDTKSARGLGLGLSLVKRIIKNYNGQIWIEDRIKGDFTKGSNFILLIPEID